jgi:hypothetical protein
MKSKQEVLQNFDERIHAFVRSVNKFEEPIVDVSAMADRIDTLTRERDEAVDRGLELQAQLMTMLVQRDAARVVTDAMVERASVALWHYWGDHNVDNDDIRVMLTAALTQEDA